MQVKITKLNRHAKLPEYQTEYSAGLDLSASIVDSIVIKPGEYSMVPLGFAIELPQGYEAQIRARSGLAAKHGITLLNGVGTIDADYRGEISVILINLSKKDFTIEPGMRIAQMIITKYRKIDWEVVDSLEETDRGEGGFGSTGL